MTDSRPFFSIVVPTWNRGDLIEQTINSFLNQEFPSSEYEIIIVDDGSTDNTVERLEPFLGRIKLLRQQNSGIAAARNLGLKHARGRYLLPFDSDDVMLPFALEVYRQVIESFQHPPVVISSVGWFHTGQFIEVHLTAPGQIKCIRCRDFFGKSIRTGAMNITFALRMDVVLEIGGYGQNSYEDNDLIYKLGTAGPMVKILSPKTAAVRIHDGNTTKGLDFVKQGLIALIRNERRGIYPGGWRRMLDRRGLIGMETLSCIYWVYLKAHQVSIIQRLLNIVVILLHARGMVLVAPLRKCLNRFYPKMVCDLIYTSNHDGSPKIIQG